MTIINSFTRQTKALALAYVLASFGASQANAAVTSAFDGNWYDPAETKRGGSKTPGLICRPMIGVSKGKLIASSVTAPVAVKNVGRPSAS